MELLKFEAEWCGPCKTQDDILEDFDAVPVTHIDVESDMERANQYSVTSVPTLVLLDDDGTPVKQWTGLTQVEEIEAEL